MTDAINCGPYAAGLQSKQVSNQETKAEETQKTQEASIYSDEGQSVNSLVEQNESIFVTSSKEEKAKMDQEKLEAQKMQESQENGNEGGLLKTIIGGVLGMMSLGGLGGLIAGVLFGNNENALPGVFNGLSSLANASEAISDKALSKGAKSYFSDNGASEKLDGSTVTEGAQSALGADTSTNNLEDAMSEKANTADKIQEGIKDATKAAMDKEAEEEQNDKESVEA